MGLLSMQPSQAIKKKKQRIIYKKKKDQLFAVSVNLSIKSRTLFFRVISVLHFAEKKTHT